MRIHNTGKQKKNIFVKFCTGDTDNTEGGAKGGAEEAERGGETQDGAAGGAV